MKTIPSARRLIAKLKANGWTPGTPAGVDSRTRWVDRQVCQRMRCPACKCRGLVYKPFRRADRYTAVAACPVCGAGEQV
jgi:hypothetical protein